MVITGCAVFRERGEEKVARVAGWVQVGCQSTRRERVVGLVLFVWMQIWELSGLRKASSPHT